MTLRLAALFCALFGVTASAETFYVIAPADGFLNLREGPGVQFKIIRKMYAGDRVQSFESSGNWRKVEHTGGIDPTVTGWASAKSLVTELIVGRSLIITQIPDGYLNLRAGPGTQHEIIHRLHPGDRVEMVDAEGNWRYVELENGLRGWAFSLYMEDEEMNMEAQPLSE